MNYVYLSTNLDNKQVFAAVQDSVEIASFVQGDNEYYQALLDNVILTGGTALDIPVPDYMQADADAKKFAQQLKDYEWAVARLAEYPLNVGCPAVTAEVVVGEQINPETTEIEYITETRVIKEAVEPLPDTITVEEFDPITMTATSEVIPNPPVVKDEEERAIAQAIIDNTPQDVKDAA